jgi:hypothetical protein
MGNIYYCYEKRKGKDRFTPHISMSEICDLPLIMSTSFHQPQPQPKNRKKIRGMFWILITSQIVNLKMAGGVLGLRKCYQCGGETLAPVVKH